MTTSARGLLSALRTARRTEDAAAARQLDLAARWADLHPPESIHSAASFTARGCEHEEPIAGVGCPAVAEFCVAELGAVLGVSTTAAKRLMGHALELRHRLPRLWGQVQSGRVPAWRARLVAEATIHATPTLTPRQPGGSTPRSPRWPGGSAPHSSTGWWRRRSSGSSWPRRSRSTPTGGRRSTPATSPSTATRRTSPGPCTSRPRSTSPTPSTSTGPSPRVPPRGPRSGPPRRWVPGGRWRSVTWPVPRPPSTSPHARGDRQVDAARRPGGGAARPLRRHHRRPGDGVRADRTPRGGPAAGAARPGQGLVRGLTDQGHHQAGHRPHHRALGTGVRGPGPAPRTDHSPRRDVRVPVVQPPGTRAAMWTTSSPTTITPPPRADPNPVPRPRPTSPRCVGTTTGSRPTPPGATRSVGAGEFEWTSPHGHRFHRDPSGSTAIEPPEPPDRR